MPHNYRKNERHTKMGYMNKWKQELQSFLPKGWAVMSFLLPLVLVPLAAKAAKKGYKYAKKKMK